MENQAVSIQLNTIEEAIEDIKNGKIIIVVDDEDRENEGDFICAAECITPEIINFMATHGRGLICTPIDENRADELELPMMVNQNTALHETAFTVSIDLIGHGCTTGISAYDRSRGIQALVDPKTKPTDFARPGHIFPLRAKSGGVLRRTGHTEAAIDLARLAGFYPAGVLVEILKKDGSMARLPELLEVAQEHDLKIIAIKDLVAYRMQMERLVKKESSFNLETLQGQIEVTAFSQITNGAVHIALKKGDWGPNDPVMVRVHSASAADETMAALFNDFNQKANKCLSMIANEGTGLFVYIRPKEEAQHFLSSLNNYKNMLESQGKGKPSFEDASVTMDQRDYGIGAQIIREMGVKKIRLISSSPKKRIGLQGYGIEIVEYVSLV